MAEIYVPEPGLYVQTVASEEHPGGDVVYLPPGWSEPDPALANHAIVSRLLEQSAERALWDTERTRETAVSDAMVEYYAKSIALQETQLEEMRSAEEARGKRVHEQMLEDQAREVEDPATAEARQAIAISMSPNQHMMVSATGMAGKHPGEFVPPGTATAPPENVDVPTIMGTGVVGETLTCTMGNWNNEPTGYTYAWQSDGTANSATGASYAVPPGDVGKAISCVVTATNAIGSTVAPPSNSLTITEGGGTRSSRRTTV
jgi:hypothetical protein